MGVRVPRVTFNADYDDESAFGDLNLCSIGYGLHQAWVYATMFGTASVFGTQNFVTGLGGAQISLPYIVSIVVYLICLIVYGFTNQKFLHIYTSRRTLIFAAIVTTLGTLLLLNLPGFPHPWFLEVVSGVLTGIGSSLFIVFWGTAFARCDSATIVLNTAVAIAIAIFLYSILFHTIPSPYDGLFVLPIPALEAFLLWQKTPESFAKRGEIPIFQPLPINKEKFAVRFGVPVLIFGVALGELRQTSIQTIVPATDAQQQILMLLASAIAMIIILITIMALGASNKWTRYFRPLIPFIIVVAFFIPLSGMSDPSFANMLLLVGFLCFEALMWIFFCELSQRFRISPVFICGLGRGLLAGGMLLGSLLPVVATNWAQSTAFGEQSLIVIMLVVMVIAYTLLPREREIEMLVAPCPLVRAVSTSLEDDAVPLNAAIASVAVSSALSASSTGGITPVASGDASAAAGASAAGATAGAETAAAAGASSAAGASDAAASGSAAASGVSNSADAGAQASEASASTSPTTAVASAASVAAATQATTAPSATSAAPTETAEASPSASSQNGASAGATQHAETTQSTGTSTSMASTNNATNSEAAHEPSEAQRAMLGENGTATGQANNDGPRRGGGRFRGKCETVANTYLLSQRETEILFLLAKGNNAAYIQDKLFISEGTAKTHIRHIYRKLDVHSQQELMRMVETAEPAE